MSAHKTGPTSIDEYIASFPRDVQDKLEKVRQTIRRAAPGAQETIKYKIPTYTLNGNLISFAAYKNHIGIYPAASGDDKFNRELAPYLAAKSAVHFPLAQPVPIKLLTKLVELHVKDNLARKQKKRTIESLNQK